MCCKRSFYWGFELSHNMKSETHHPFVPMYYSLVVSKTVFLCFYHSRLCVEFPTPKKRMTPENWYSTHFLWRTSLFGVRADYFICLLLSDEQRVKLKTRGLYMSIGVMKD